MSPVGDTGCGALVVTRLVDMPLECGGVVSTRASAQSWKMLAQHRMSAGGD